MALVSGQRLLPSRSLRHHGRSDRIRLVNTMPGDDTLTGSERQPIELPHLCCGILQVHPRTDSPVESSLSRMRDKKSLIQYQVK